MTDKVVLRSHRVKNCASALPFRLELNVTPGTDGEDSFSALAQVHRFDDGVLENYGYGGSFSCRAHFHASILMGRIETEKRWKWRTRPAISSAIRAGGTIRSSVYVI